MENDEKKKGMSFGKKLLFVSAGVGTFFLAGCDYDKIAKNIGDYFRNTGNTIERKISEFPEEKEEIEQKFTREFLYLAPAFDPTLKQPLSIEFYGGMPESFKNELLKEGGFIDTVCGKDPRNIVAGVSGALKNKIDIYSSGRDASGNEITKVDTWKANEVYPILTDAIENREVVRIGAGVDDEGALHIGIEYDFDKEDGINPYKVGNSEEDNKVTHIRVKNSTYAGEGHRTLKEIIKSHNSKKGNE